ncbi:acyltransferase [Pseudomonas sp. Z1-29]|uniref:acyltransferase family protein n=1 Tax=Pseudomonas sp. Z1-29 TaxID=2817410 RepID=UPI003DA937AD
MNDSIRYAGADGIRGFACIIVLCVHAAAMFFSSTYMPLAGTGKIGVWLFFVLSAFLLTSKFERTGFSFYAILVYGLGRVLRIMPLFAIVVCLYYFLGTANIVTGTDAKNAILLTQGFAHLWTIPVEFKFYVVLPVVAFGLVRAKAFGGHAATLSLAVILIALQQGFWPYWATTENSISTRWYLSSFTLGCYFAVSFEYYRESVKPALADFVGVAVICLMVLSSPFMRNVLFDMPMDKWLQNKFVYLSLFWGLFIVALADGKGVIGAILQSAIMNKLGAWSFSIYLVHWYFYVTLSSAHPDSFGWMLVGVGLAVVFGALLHYVVEAPIERMRHSIQERIKPKVAAAA